MGAYSLYGALSQRRLLGTVKSAYDQSRLDGRLKLTASTFNRPWIRMLAVLVTVPTVMQNSLHPLSTSATCLVVVKFSGMCMCTEQHPIHS